MKHDGVVHMQLGKNGITEGVITDINEKFQNQDPLVIKMNRTFKELYDRKQAAQQIADQTSSRIESLVGGTLILTRKRA